MVITFADALKEMEKGSFSIVFIKFDKKSRDNNGKIRTFENAVLAKNRPGWQSSQTSEGPKINKKDPDHYTNSTRNIYVGSLPRDQRIRKVHLNLILSINGKEVYP